MKKISIFLALAVAASVAVVAMSGCSNNGGGQSTVSTVSSEAGDNTTSSEESTATDEGSAQEASKEVDLKTADYDNPAVTIEFGQFEEIQTVTSDMQSGKYDGQVIKVTGISQKRMSSCTVMEKDESTGTSYGMTYYLDGNPDLSEYPAEDAKVELLGVVTTGDYGVRALTVLPENVKVLDS